MSKFRAALILGGLGSLLAAPVPAQVLPPELTTPPAVDVNEGDSGSTTIQLAYVLDKVSLTDITFDLDVVWQTWSAIPGADFAEFPRRNVLIPAGETTALVDVEVLGDTHTEQDQEFQITIENLVGATFASGSGYGTTIRIIEDDINDVTDWVVVDDVFYEFRNVSFVQLELDSNDQTNRAWYSSFALTFEMLEAPAHGSFQYTGSARGRFHFEPGHVGTEVFRYRLCLATTCRDAKATVHVMPVARQYLRGDGHSGYREVPGRGVEGRMLATTPLVSATRVPLSVGVDRSPQDPWNGDDGAATHVIAVPAWSAGQPRERIARARLEGGGRLFAGVDADGDGQLSASEAVCSDVFDTCQFSYAVGDAASAWIVRVHNQFEFPIEPILLTHDIPVAASDGSLTATGPGQESALAFEDVHLGWNDPRLASEDVHAGVVRVKAADGTKLVDVPVDVSRSENTESLPIPLVSGREQVLRLDASVRQSRMFLDVPAGAQRLRVVVTGDAPGGTGFYVARQSAAIDAADSAIALAPNAAQAAATGRTGVAAGAVVVEGGALAPGRWYIVPDNTGDAPVALAVTATVEAVAPVVRSGSYFNPARGGSGLFLYPAADQWTGLWYTYFVDGRPTWYYLQGDAPGDNGLRRSPIFRATWNGTSRTLTAVGEATLTPSGPDAFTLTYTIDGVAGSQPMQALGRGCPAQGGSPVDISGTWFDPAKSGTGYSVQMWSNYEYHAAFIYDEQGVPMFLAAELGRFGGNDATLALERLIGSCPTCAWQAPVRTEVGTFVRRLAGNSLRTVEVDAIWQDGNPPFYLPPVSTWSAVDTVQALGGASATQGCGL